MPLHPGRLTDDRARYLVVNEHLLGQVRGRDDRCEVAGHVVDRPAVGVAVGPAGNLASCHRPLGVEGNADIGLTQVLREGLDLVEEGRPTGLDVQQQEGVVFAGGSQPVVDDRVRLPVPPQPAASG